jgi:RpiR family transcriptional regulator, carbohydrate utilization regulator
MPEIPAPTRPAAPMTAEPALPVRIRSEMGRLSKAEAKVARAILADPEAAIRTSLAALARAAGVSEPTVIRFCRSFGLNGYPGFKLRLAQDLAAGVPFVSPHISAGDDTGTLARKIFSSTIATMQATAATLDPHRIEKAVAALAGAERIVVFGVGGSASVALDAYHKLVRLTFACQQASDPVIARMMLPAMGPADVLLALSYTGRTRAVLDLAEEAARRGVQVIAVTARSSPLAALADPALLVAQAEDSELFTPTTTRIAMLAMIDVLATSVALAGGTQASERLAAIKRILVDTRLPSDGQEREEG